MHHTTFKLSHHRNDFFNRNVRDNRFSDLMTDLETLSITRKHKNLNMEENFPGIEYCS